MKAIIWIIVVILIAWGVWWWFGRDNLDTNVPVGDASGITAPSTSELPDLNDDDFNSKG